VIQRVLETDGKLTLMDQNEIITPNPNFRLFATANTVGLGDTTGLYHGTQQINQAQMDRWSLVATLNYLSQDAETAIILSKAPTFNTETGRKTIAQMVTVADLTRTAFMNGDLSTVMSPRTFAITRWNSENPSNGEAGPIAKDPFDVEATRLVELAASRLHSGDPNALTDFIAMERLRLYNLYNDSIFEDTDLAYAQQDEFDEVGEYCDAAILELPEMQRLLQ